LLQKALIARGYEIGEVNNVMNSQTKAALLDFQRKNNLPVGNLNLITFDMLGIN